MTRRADELEFARRERLSYWRRLLVWLFGEKRSGYDRRARAAPMYDDAKTTKGKP